MFSNVDKAICAAIAYLALFLFIPAEAYSQSAEGDCSAGAVVNGEWQCIYIERELAQIAAYFEGLDGPLLSAAQALVGTEPDGKWGPDTERAFRRSLETYIAIGGRGGDWGISRPSDTARYIRWLAAAHHASATGGEFPD